MISQCNKKQMSVSMSTTKAQYIITCSTSCEAVWLQKLLAGPFDVELEMTCVSQHIEYLISLYPGYGAERSSEALVCCNGRLDSRCLDQASSESEVGILKG